MQPQNANLLISALFARLQENGRDAEVDDVNALMFNIIESREPKSNTNTETNLDQLPKPIIGEAASFLEQKENTACAI